MLHGMQVSSVAKLFGVKASKSPRTASFHEKFCLTELVKLPQAGILTRHGDMLVCFAAYATFSVSAVVSCLNTLVAHTSVLLLYTYFCTCTVHNQGTCGTCTVHKQGRCEGVCARFVPCLHDTPCYLKAA